MSRHTSGAVDEMLLPSLATGTYYICVLPQGDPEGMGECDITVRRAAMGIVEVSPRRAGRNSTVTFSVEGARLIGAEFTLRNTANGTSWRPEFGDQFAPGRFNVRFDMRKIPAGIYRMHATRPAVGEVVYEFTIEVYEGGSPEIVSWLEGPSRARPHATINFNYVYRNNGSLDARGMVHLIQVTPAHMFAVLDAKGNQALVKTNETGVIVITPYLPPDEEGQFGITIYDQRDPVISVKSGAVGLMADSMMAVVEDAFEQTGSDKPDSIKNGRTESGLHGALVSSIVGDDEQVAEHEAQAIALLAVTRATDPCSAIDEAIQRGQTVTIVGEDAWRCYEPYLF